MSKEYKEVIAIIARANNEELAQVAVKLAQEKPEIFLSLLDEALVYDRLAKFLDTHSGQLVICIREVRSELGLGLRDAKDVVDFALHHARVYEFTNENAERHAEKLRRAYNKV